MDDKLLTKKIQALLHDPPEKPIILGRVGHEGRAKEIMAELGLLDQAAIPPEVKTADHIASAADRINLPKDENFVVNFLSYPVIKHPLSAKEFDLKNLRDVDIENIMATIDRAVVYLESKYSGCKEKLYLAIWRELLDCLRDKENDKAELGRLWELLPAETRIPDHSIWEHKRVTSAIAGALPDPAFLLFTIGPVQEFIATARKTQDLWAGSYLLSYLSWSAMKVVAEEFGPDSIIFPDLCGQPLAEKWLIDEKKLILGTPYIDADELSTPTLTNRVLAIVPQSAVKEIAEKAKDEVKKTFIEVCNKVKEKIEKKLKIDDLSVWNSLWERQIKDFNEIYWAALPIDVNNYGDFLKRYKELMGLNGETEFDKLLKEYKERGFTPNIGTVYGQIYRLVEKSLGSRKMVRDYKQTDEPNHKCTLCGVREPVHRGIYNNNPCSEDFGALRGFWQEKVLPAFPQIRRSERLCAICITKRLSPKYYFREFLNFEIHDSFPSVSMIATASFKLRVIENMSNPDLAVKVGCFVARVEQLAGDRSSGFAVPMVKRASRDEISRKFARLEGDWLYRETFDDEKTLWEENKNCMSKKEFDKLLSIAKQKHKELFDTIKDIDKEKPKNERIGEPSIYYAVIHMDGDDMGKLLSGDSAPQIRDVLHPIVKNTIENDRAWHKLLSQKRPLNPSLHLATSKALRNFSLYVVREIVEKDHLGKLIYAGGDELLAFVNLKDLPEVMRKLRAHFSGSLFVNEETRRVDIDFKDGSGFIPVDEQGIPLNVGNNEKKVKGYMLSMGAKATASMGVVITHHNSNLAQVLDEVRRCLKEVKKKIEKKNAFCIALAKRAGGTEYFKAKWYYESDGKIFETIPLLRQWADAFYSDRLSPKFVYTFWSEKNGVEGLPVEAIKFELLRIAKRHWKEESNKQALNDLIDDLMNLHKHGLSLDDIGNFLSLAAFLGREDNR